MFLLFSLVTNRLVLGQGASLLKVIFGKSIEIRNTNYLLGWLHLNIEKIFERYLRQVIPLVHLISRSVFLRIDDEGIIVLSIETVSISF